MEKGATAAHCPSLVADQFEMARCGRGLTTLNMDFQLTRWTGFDSDQVIHTRGVNNGDILCSFAIIGGMVVARGCRIDLATKTITPSSLESAYGSDGDGRSDYSEDSKRENSSMKGDMIMLGTKSMSQQITGRVQLNEPRQCADTDS